MITAFLSDILLDLQQYEKKIASTNTNNHYTTSKVIIFIHAEVVTKSCNYSLQQIRATNNSSKLPTSVPTTNNSSQLPTSGHSYQNSSQYPKTFHSYQQQFTANNISQLLTKGKSYQQQFTTTN
jgi:hypothetical protein